MIDQHYELLESTPQGRSFLKEDVPYDLRLALRKSISKSVTNSYKTWFGDDRTWYNEYCIATSCKYDGNESFVSWIALGDDHWYGGEYKIDASAKSRVGGVPTSMKERRSFWPSQADIDVIMPTD